MMNFLTYITGFFMNFELLPILTLKKRGDEIKKFLVMAAILDIGRG
jgi:hypothetical protein